MPSDRSREVELTRHTGPDAEAASDRVVIEDPLEIRLAGVPLAVTMRTPGDDEDLVTGFLLTEGILLEPSEIARIERREDSRVEVTLREGVQVDPHRFQRNMFVSSSCGVCGKASLEAVQLAAPRAPEFSVRREVLASLPDALRSRQPTFDETGGLHAAGVYDLEGTCLSVREDVGRHNAADKAIGAAARQRWPLPLALLVVSGRQSFEIVQKATLARLCGVVGVSAPSSLAVELAQAQRMLLVGFARGEGMNVYAGEGRIGG